MAERCTAATRSGTPCKGRVWRDGLCRFHHPATEQERAEARRKGGENKSNAARAERKMVQYKIEDVRVVLSTAMHEVFMGRMDIGLAAALATLGRAVILANERSDLEARLAELERRAGITPDEGAR